MTRIEIFGGMYIEEEGEIMLSGQTQDATGKLREKPLSEAIAEAHTVIASRSLLNVAIVARGTPVWADAVATEILYPRTGERPAATRSGSPGNVFAQSAVACPWDSNRHKLIDYA